MSDDITNPEGLGRASGRTQRSSALKFDQPDEMALSGSRRSTDPLLAALGFGPSTSTAPIAIQAPDVAAPAATHSPLPAATQPLTRREMRERERAAAAGLASASQITPSQVVAIPETRAAARSVVAQMPAATERMTPVVIEQTPTAVLPAAQAAERQPAASVAEPAVSATEPVTAEPASPFRVTPTVAAPDAAASPRRSGRRAAASAPVESANRRAKPARTAASASRVARHIMSGAAFLFAGALLVGTTVPANAFRTESYEELGTDAPKQAEAQVVELVAADAVEAAPGRDPFTVTSYAQVLREKYGKRDFSFSTTGMGAVRWPFAFSVPISSGYGDRAAPCRGCSSDHKGVDFVPGAGTPISSIAAGTVLKAEYGSGFGHFVKIEHEINGQTVTSLYAHMQAASPLNPGDVVEPGEFVGKVGNTGASTGAHLHFEIEVEGLHVNPFTWLRSNAE
ncbi:M23 family metallopeptidase [Diaminobutyricimonas sp. TR449]|uniref:M23 family metallopeptidase n=1 Tax=Diaminobutyricimonas sp. TR449 TaxID=2708076 RepID=UPI00141E04AE|nr:M23 family metallopeptidase [Diaminobutyricimonas sp. TR449]